MYIYHKKNCEFIGPSVWDHLELSERPWFRVSSIYSDIQFRISKNHPLMAKIFSFASFGTELPKQHFYLFLFFLNNLLTSQLKKVKELVFKLCGNAFPKVEEIAASLGKCPISRNNQKPK